MDKYSRALPTHYGTYYQGYIDQVQGMDAIESLNNLSETTFNTLLNLKEEKWNYAYASGKWTIKELVQHVIDTERVFAFRALWIGRNSGKPLPGFDQDVYVSESMAATRSPQELLRQYRNTRAQSLDIFLGMPEAAADYIGEASGYPLTPRACAWIIAGHERHHMRVLEERYLTA